jgi:hypothetical protein
MPSISPSSRFTMRRLRVGIKSNLLFRFTTTIGRSTSRVSPGDSLLEQLSFPFLQKAVDFYDEFMEFLRGTRWQLARGVRASVLFLCRSSSSLSNFREN